MARDSTLRFPPGVAGHISLTFPTFPTCHIAKMVLSKPMSLPTDVNDPMFDGLREYFRNRGAFHYTVFGISFFFYRRVVLLGKADKPTLGSPP